MALAMLCGGTCNALREIIHVILKNDIVFHGDDNYKIDIYKKKSPAISKDYRETPHVGVDGFEPPTLCL